MQRLMTRNDLALLVEAAQRSGIELGRLRAANPWSFKGPVAVRLQQAMQELSPSTALRLKSEACKALSLETTAVFEGLLPLEHRFAEERTLIGAP